MKALLFLSLFAISAFGGVTVSYKNMNLGQGTKVIATWEALSGGAVDSTLLEMGGYVVKVVTNPGSTAPTANYDIACGDPSDTSLDVFASALNNRHTTNTEQVYPAIAGAPGTVSSTPVYVSNCTLAFSNNSVSFANGTVEFYVVKSR